MLWKNGKNMDLLPGHNWRVGRLGNCPPRFWQNRRRTALLLAHPAFGSYLRPCVIILLAVSGPHCPHMLRRAWTWCMKWRSDLQTSSTNLIFTPSFTQDLLDQVSTFFIKKFCTLLIKSKAVNSQRIVLYSMYAQNENIATLGFCLSRHFYFKFT